MLPSSGLYDIIQILITSSHWRINLCQIMGPLFVLLCVFLTKYLLSTDATPHSSPAAGSIPGLPRHLNLQSVSLARVITISPFPVTEQVMATTTKLLCLKLFLKLRQSLLCGGRLLRVVKEFFIHWFVYLWLLLCIFL